MTATENRETWSSRPAFLFAAIGAAVGFGNVWRFPAMVHEYGGGVALLPYLLGLIFIGIPLLIHEIAMGQHLQKSEVVISGYFSKHFRGAGLASILCGFFVVCYYAPLISWCLRVFFESFGKMRDDWEDISGSEASKYFFQDVIGTSTLDEDMRPNHLVVANVVYLAMTWIVVGSCTAFGIRWTGRIAYVTMGLPIVMLLILLVRSVTLPGASKSISEYIGNWDWAVLVDKPDVWSTAVSQSFFSLGIAFGVMTAFGSHCERDAPAFQNSIIIAVSNTMFSFVSGLCVFGILGYISTLEADFRIQAGPAFLFAAYPAALSTIPLGLHWVRFLFFNLVLLGLDGAFATVEAIVSVIEDSTYNKLTKPQLVACICSLGFLCGLLYTTNAALQFLDVVDFYVNFVLLFLGFCKAFSAGWMYNIQNQIKILGFNLVYTYMVATFGSVFLASLVWFGVAGNTFLLGVLCLVTIYGMGAYYCYEKLDSLQNIEAGHTLKSLSHELLMGNILDLRAEMEESVGYIPYAWAVVIKHVIPQVLLVLFFNLAFSRTNHGQWEFGNYGDYVVWPFQIIGLACFFSALLVVVAGLAKARIFDGFVGIQQELKAESFELVEKEQETDYVEMQGMDDEGEMVPRISVVEKEETAYCEMTAMDEGEMVPRVSEDDVGVLA